VVGRAGVDRRFEQEMNTVRTGMGGDTSQQQ
jgi:hypothetical protein